MAKQTYAVGRFTLEPRRQLLDDGQPVALGGKALDLLSVLAEAHGALVTKDELMAAVWPNVIIEENAIQVHMSALRKALGDEAVRLVTVRGLGYRLALEDVYPGSFSEHVDAVCAIAVLPFVNLTGDSSKDYLGDGMAEELITTLLRSTGMKVSARASSFAYKGRDSDVRQIASDLGVTTILDGSIRKSGDRLRVSAQLIDATTGFHVWAQSYDRSDADVLALQDELAMAIAAALQVELGTKTDRPKHPEAVRLCAQGRALAGHVSLQSLRMAIDLQEQALALDPQFARGHVDLAGTLMIAAANGVVPAARMDEALDHLDQAILLDPGDAAAHGVRAAIDATAGRWIAAEVGFRAAAERSRVEPTALISSATSLLAPCGHGQRSVRAALAAVELAPASTANRSACALLALQSGEDDIARSQFDMATLLGLAPEQRAALILRSEMALLDGRFEDAGTFMAMAMQPGWHQPLTDAVSAIYAAFAGNEDPATAIAGVNDLVAGLDRPDGGWRRGNMVGVFMWALVKLGAIDDAYRVVDRINAVVGNSPHLAPPYLWQMWRPDMLDFRSDKRFQAIVERFGMIDYWLRFGAPDGYRLAGRQLVREI